MGGVRSPLDPSPTAVALAASCLARLGYRGGNPALGLPADPTGKLAAGTCWGHRLSGWISPPLFGRAGLSRCPARPADRVRRRGLPIQSWNLHCALPASARCQLVNRIPSENGCKIVAEKAGFILRSDLEAGASIFARGFFPISGSWRLLEEGELCITELNLAFRIVLASLFCCWYFLRLFLERRRVRRRTEPLQRAHPSTT